MTKYLAGAIVLLALMVAPFGLAVDSPSMADAGLPDVAAPGSSTASERCSTATARALVERHRLDAFLVPNPIGQLLCGPFAGPASDAMAVTIRAPTCWGIQRWAVFRFSQGDWQLVLDRIAFIFPLVVVGPDLRETTPVFRQGDSRCNPSGGTHARTWHWNGTRFAVGAWKQVTPGSAPAPALTSGYFKTPSGNIVCYHSPGPKDMPRAFIGCGIKSGLKPAPPRRPCDEGGYAGDRVSMTATGRVDVPPCAGDPGALVGEREASVLGYGKTWSGGGLSCASAVAGLTCRNKSGHGFFLSRAHWRAF
jgi:hypothetical protein